MPDWTGMLDRMTQGSYVAPPFVGELSLPMPYSWEPGEVLSRWTVSPSMFHERKALFGGYLAALADHALGLAAMSVLKEDEVFVTSDLRVSYFRPVMDGSLGIAARVIHRGRGQMHAEVTFTREDGKMAAKATATQVILQE